VFLLISFLDARLPKIKYSASATASFVDWFHEIKSQATG
jgi:hypothetical protein